MRKLLSLLLTISMLSSQIICVTALAEENEVLLKNTALYSFAFSSENEVASDMQSTDKPILSGGAEYSAENQNVCLNAKSGTPKLDLILSQPLTALTDKNVINVEFDMNFGSYSGQSFTYSVSSSGGALIDFRFEPYKDNGMGYLKIGTADVITDELNDDDTVKTPANKQIKNCVSSKTDDGMKAETTHFRNEINLVSGTAAVYITSGSKSGEFSGEFDTNAYSDISSVSMGMSKANTSRYTYADNLKISQYLEKERPDKSELLYCVIIDADGAETIVDTSKMVYGDNITSFLVTTANNGQLVKQYTTDIADSVTVDTTGADKVEVSPVYSYTNLEEQTFNTAEGAVLPTNILEYIEDGLYDFDIKKTDSTLTDIFVNGGMVVNNAEQSGTGRATPKGALYTIPDVKIEGGTVNIQTRRDEYSGRTYPNAPISYITMKKAPSIVNHKPKITILGDSLVANYYGGLRGSEPKIGSSRTGWGQALSEFIDTDKYNIVNLANSGHYAKILYETAMSGAINNSAEGDIILCQCGYNDRVRSNETEMAEYMTKMAEDADAAGVTMIFVAPPATCDDETKYNSGYSNPIDTSASDYVNSSYTYPVRYGQTVKETAESLNAGFIDLSKFSYDYLTSIYGTDRTEAEALYKAGIGVSDGIHLSYAGAMKWAAFVAQELFNRKYIEADVLNLDKKYTVTQTVTDGNETRDIVIKCQVSDGSLPSELIGDYSVFKNDNSVGVIIKSGFEGVVYAAMYDKNDRLIGAKMTKELNSEQTLGFDIPDENGAYIRIFNWTEDMEPLSAASEAISVDDIVKDIADNYPDSLLNGKKVYAFGDSIVKGHNAPEKAFMKLLANDYNVDLTMCAVNGASIITQDSAKEDPSEVTTGNYILTQVNTAPDEKPDIIIFNGGTNDAYGSSDSSSEYYDKAYNSNGSHTNLFDNIGEIQGKNATAFNTNTFCGGFEAILYSMRQKWGDVPIVYVTTHKSGGRSWQPQCKVRELALSICEEWDVEVADIFKDTTLDTRNEEQMKQYIINGAGSHPNETACRKFYIPLVKLRLKEVLPEIIPDNVSDKVDLAVFAGQSNMSGRGKASDTVVCDVNAGFEYKSVSNPKTLVPIIEPFGLDEDREGAIYDYNSNGTTKRTGSMVSAAVDEYYKRTGRQLVAVSASIGGTSTAQWKSNYINDAVKRLDDAKAFLERNGITVGRTFVVWCQGESDGDAKVSAETYTANIKDLFNTFKAHGAQKCFMVQIGHYNYIDYPGTLNGLNGEQWDAKYGIIRDAQAEICENDSDFVLAGSLEPYISDMKDRYHYNQETYNAVGKTVGGNIAEYYN